MWSHHTMLFGFFVCFPYLCHSHGPIYLFHDMIKVRWCLMPRPLVGLLIALFLPPGLAGCSPFTRPRPRPHRPLLSLLPSLMRHVILSPETTMLLLSLLSDYTNKAVPSLRKDRGCIYCLRQDSPESNKLYV